MSILNEERFYIDLDRERIIWMYHNPDAFSGDQYVKNIVDKEKFQIAMTYGKTEKGYDVNDIFCMMEEDCLQYLADVGTESYKDFEEQFNSTPDAIGIEMSTLETILLYFKIKEEINTFCMEEYGSHADFTNINAVGIAYTTTEDEEHEMWVCANIPNYSLDYYIDGQKVSYEQANSLKEYAENYFEGLNFDEVISPYSWGLEYPD